MSSSKARISLLILMGLACLIIFSNLGGIPLLDPDEPVYAETAREMLAFNDFISPRIYGEYWYDKPPMYYWLVALSFKLFGISELTTRLPSAILGILCLIKVYRSGSRLFNERVGITAALVLTTSLEFFYLAKAGVTDITLTLFLTLALLAFIEHKYYQFYFFAGLATLTKGPVGLVFPVGIGFFYLLLSGQLRELKHLKLGSGLLLYVLIAIPWYGIMYDLHGEAFFDTFLGFHNLTRFTTPEHPESVFWYYYIPVIIVGFFPWAALAPQAIWQSFGSRGREHRILLFLNLWAGLIFLFFTISQTKLVSYILPVFPPLALIVGWYVVRLINTGGGGKAIRHWLMTVGLLSLLLITAMLYAIKLMPALQTGIFILSGTLLLMIIFVGLLLERRQIGRAFLTQVVAMAIIALTVFINLIPRVTDNFSSRAIANLFLDRYDREAPVYVVKFLHPGFTFYSKVYGQEIRPNEDITDILLRQEKAYFILRRTDYEGLPAQVKYSLRELAAVVDKVLLVSQ